MITALHTAPIVGNLHWPNEQATQDGAAALAKKAALANAIIELHGDLGAGKTTFVRYLLTSLGVQGRIKSPSYAVLEPYEVASPWEAARVLPIWHFDFYRFNDPRELEEAGFRDILAGPGLKLIEWADNARAALPGPDLSIDLQVLGDASRRVRLQAHSAIGTALLS